MLGCSIVYDSTRRRLMVPLLLESLTPSSNLFTIVLSDHPTSPPRYSIILASPLETITISCPGSFTDTVFQLLSITLSLFFSTFVHVLICTCNLLRFARGLSSKNRYILYIQLHIAFNNSLHNIRLFHRLALFWRMQMYWVHRG